MLRLPAFCLALFLLLLTGLTAQAQPSATASAPNCELCRERLLTLNILRQRVPADWQLYREREPVWNSQTLVIEAGLEHSQTILLVHGLGQNGFTDWASVIPELARQYHVLALDLPGFGYSDAPAGKYSPTHYARVLSTLLTRHAKGRAIVIGHSMGGAVALRLAASRPELLSRLILVDAAGILHRTAFTKHSITGRLGSGQTSGTLRGLLERVRDFSDSTIERVFGLPDPGRLLGISEELWAGAFSGQANANAAAALVEEDFSNAATGMPLPTWLIWGEADPVAPLRTGQMLARRLPQAQLLSLPGVGHTPMEAASFNAFMNRLDRALSEAPQGFNPPATPPVSHRDYLCQGENGGRLSGQFREVRIENCAGLLLQDLVAERLIIRDSIVQMLNTRIHGDETGITLINSELVATASEINAPTAIHAERARLDLAGVILEGSDTAISTGSTSRFIASACPVRSPDFMGLWHTSETRSNTRQWP